MRTAQFLIVLLAASGVPAQSSYCKWTPLHTLCRFQNGALGDSCGDSVTVRGVDERQRQSILQAHNALRSLVASGAELRGRPGPQPAASNMQVMVWDQELASVAQTWADQCNFEHDCGQCRRVDRFQVGQNLALETTTAPTRPANWKKMITNWYEEVELFSNATVRNYRFEAATGHYTAVVWAETSRVGCGFSTYRQNGRLTNLYVCNYGPAGNFIGQPVYKTGRGCSQCAPNFACSAQFANLCEPVKKPTPPVDSTPTTPAAATARPTARPTVRPTVPTTPAPRPTVATPPTGFSCRVGRAQCRAAYVGKPWAFRKDATESDYLETRLAAGEETELRLSQPLEVGGSGGSGQLCLGLRLRETVVNPTQTAVRLFVPATALLIRPRNATPLTVNLAPPQDQDRWTQVRLTLSGLSQPFQLVVRQQGPRLDGAADAAVAIRLALTTLTLNDGPCV